LSTFAHPVSYTLLIDTQAFFLATSNWIKESNTLNKTTVASSTLICNSQMIKWTLLGAATRQSDNYHIVSLIQVGFNITHGLWNQSGSVRVPIEPLSLLAVKRRVFYAKTSAM
jgi:hypothetical protein